jgi:hypothetical protein
MGESRLSLSKISSGGGYSSSSEGERMSSSEGESHLHCLKFV